MRKILGDLGTMCLGVTAIMIAAVTISLGTDEGPQMAPVAGFIVLGATWVVLRILSNYGDNSADGR